MAHLPGPRRSRCPLLLVASAALSALSCAATVPPPVPATASDEFPGAGTPVALASPTPFQSLEGPFWMATGGFLLFSDVLEANAPGARIYRYDPAARSFSVLPYPPAPGGGPTSTNGLAEAGGALLACERYNARLVRLETDGRLTVLADRFPAGPAGHRLLAPNDLVVRRDGNIYFSDTDWGTRPGGDPNPMSVYRLSPRGELERVLAIDKPNGVALSPDGGTLYVGSDRLAKVWRLPVDASGKVGSETLLIDGAQIPGGFKVPDGICVDDTGTLFVTNNADEIKAIAVFSPDGHFQGRIHLPAAPSNCTFGGPDRRTMYVTTLHAVYQVPMRAPGLP